MNLLLTRFQKSMRPCRVLVQKGFTLIEVMVSLAIGLVLLAGLVTLLGQQSSTRAEVDRAGFMIENGRYALMYIRDNLQHAGYYGQYGESIAAPPAMPDPCALDVNSRRDALGLIVHGYDSPSTVPAPLSACLPPANHVPGTDILVVRRSESSKHLVTPSNLTAGEHYIQGTPVQYIFDSADNAAAFTLMEKNGVTPAPVTLFSQYIFYVSPCNVFASGQTTCTAAADNGAPIPTLKRLEYSVASGAPRMIETPLVEGIETLQLEYGIADGNNVTPRTPLVKAPAYADWVNVMSVGIHVISRSLTPSPDHVDRKSYNLGLEGMTTPKNDRYKRHHFSTYVRLLNPSGRRE